MEGEDELVGLGAVEAFFGLNVNYDRDGHYRAAH